MSSLPRDLERDLAIAESSAADLKDYLLSDQVFWSLSTRGPARNPFPKGTLGGLLFRLAMLDALPGALTPDQWERLEAARTTADGMLRQWGVQAEDKAKHEAASRTRTWKQFLDEASLEPPRFQAEYEHQVEGRVCIASLMAFAGRAIEGATRDLLTAADKRLLQISSDDAFVWDEVTQPAFPEDRYPWLYLRLR
jgi:hypothetical protein